jgi:hypothetical protein
MKKFYIDIAYVTDTVVKKQYRITQRKDESSEDFLIRKLSTDNIAFTTTGNADHPEFTKLREQLGVDGYIGIERGWWNGDRVLKPFQLNDVSFKVGRTFPCASAMNYVLRSGKTI